jgi:hypothetical protein
MYLFTFRQTSLYIIRTLDSHFHSLSLDSEKSRIEYGNNCKYNRRSYWRAFLTKISIPINKEGYKEVLGVILKGCSGNAGFVPSRGIEGNHH